jgi:hypothetical protein
MEKEKQKFIVRYCGIKSWGSKEMHKTLITTLGDDAYGVSQIKI